MTPTATTPTTPRPQLDAAAFTLRVATSDFWVGAQPERTPVIRALREITPVRVVPGPATPSCSCTACSGRSTPALWGPRCSSPERTRRRTWRQPTSRSAITPSTGYTTEKLCDALAAGTIPIYWGNPRVAEDVHPECFINASDFDGLHALVEHVAAVDRDPELAAAYRARHDYLVRPIDAYWDELVRFMARVVESIPTQSRAAQRARAVRLVARSTPARVARSVSRRMQGGHGRGHRRGRAGS